MNTKNIATFGMLGVVASMMTLGLFLAPVKAFANPCENATIDQASDSNLANLLAVIGVQASATEQDAEVECEQDIEQEQNAAVVNAAETNQASGGGIQIESDNTNAAATIQNGEIDQDQDAKQFMGEQFDIEADIAAFFP